MSQQVNPLTLAEAFPQLAKSLQKDMSTSIPLDDIGSWVTLALRIKNGHVRSLPFTDAVINTGNPDFDKIQALVQQALKPPTTPSPAASSSHAAGTNARTHDQATPKAPPDPSKAVDVKEVC
jgi:hypothetical protein